MYVCMLRAKWANRVTITGTSFYQPRGKLPVKGSKQNPHKLMGDIFKDLWCIKSYLDREMTELMMCLTKACLLLINCFLITPQVGILSYWISLILSCLKLKLVFCSLSCFLPVFFHVCSQSAASTTPFMPPKDHLSTRTLVFGEISTVLFRFMLDHFVHRFCLF